MVGLVGNKANLSPSSVGARVGAELGNIHTQKQHKEKQNKSIEIQKEEIKESVSPTASPPRKKHEVLKIKQEKLIMKLR